MSEANKSTKVPTGFSDSDKAFELMGLAFIPSRASKGASDESASQSTNISTNHESKGMSSSKNPPDNSHKIVEFNERHGPHESLDTAKSKAAKSEAPNSENPFDDCYAISESDASGGKDR
ncbi:hypothetical protein P7C73_g2854, partial [Tremellales sp. Uapishka_1]